MSIRTEWFDVNYVSLNGIVRGEDALDGQELDTGDMGVEIYADGGAVITGTADELREFGRRIIETVNATEKREVSK